MSYLKILTSGFFSRSFWLALGACVVWATPAQTVELGIAAVVNEAIITTADLDDRIALTRSLAGLPDNPDVNTRLRGQTMRTLIDEQLQEQEAARLSITVSPDEVAQAIGQLEQRRGAPAGSLLDALKETGLSEDSFRDQISAQLRWNKILQQRVRREVTVSQDEMALAKQKMRQGRSEIEWKISTVNIPVHSTQEEAAAKELAELLAEEWQKGKATEAIEEQLRNDPAASVEKGKWLQPGQLKPELLAQINQMQSGEVGQPIRTFEGYQILRLEDRRTVAIKPTNAEIALKEIFIKVEENAPDAEVDVLLQIASDIRLRPGNCRDDTIAGLESFEGLNIESKFIRTELERLNERMQPIVTPLGVGEVSEPFATPDGIRLLMLCEKIEKPIPLPEDDWVHNQLVQEGMSLAAAKFMRNLRRQAFLDVRI